MKMKQLAWTILIILMSVRCYGQQDKYKLFRDYLLEHCKPPKSVIDQCGWQLAMVKLTTNKQGRVVAYGFLNQASDSLKLSFKPLIGYKFPARLNMQNKTFVFAHTFYNLKGNCIGPGHADAQNVFEITYGCIAKQLLANPKTIFYDVTMTTLGTEESIR
jgi:hypothetical protein